MTEHALHQNCTRDYRRALPGIRKGPPGTPCCYGELAACWSLFSNRLLLVLESQWPESSYKERLFGLFFSGHRCDESGHCGWFSPVGIDIDSIISIQRKASNITWMVSFDSPVSNDAALNEQSDTISGCVVFLGDCQNKVSIVKLHELPMELPESVIIGCLSHYGRVSSF